MDLRSFITDVVASASEPDTVVFGSRLCVGLVLIVAATAKSIVLPEFRQAMSDLDLVPRDWVPMISLLIPICEVIVGVLLLVNIAPQQSAMASAALFLVFAVAVAVALSSQPKTRTCRCFGLRQRLTWRLVLRNIGLASLAVAAMGTPYSVLLALVGTTALFGSLEFRFTSTMRDSAAYR